MTAFLLTLDHNLFCIINSHHSAFWDGFFPAISWLGSGWVATPILVAISLLKVPRKKFLAFFIFAAAGFILSSTINTQIKNAAQRPRPIGYFVTHRVTCPGSHNGLYTVHVVGEPLATRSFPSGHANTAFCAAAVLAFFFGGWFWLAFVPAFLVAYARVYAGVHFPLDTAFGGLLGITMITLAYFAYNKTGTAVQEKLEPLLTRLFFPNRKRPAGRFVAGREDHDPQ
ncbi:MAG TPA: phosphatase PAP2 family protein [Chitinivibrionales bacterium]|nr:phosphatase PAP2 family protein [Chitinivibrionales bacterium]